MTLHLARLLVANSRNRFFRRLPWQGARIPQAKPDEMRSEVIMPEAAEAWGDALPPVEHLALTCHNLSTLIKVIFFM
jgi:hypothetical protein